MGWLPVIRIILVLLVSSCRSAERRQQEVPPVREESFQEANQAEDPKKSGLFFGLFGGNSESASGDSLTEKPVNFQHLSFFSYKSPGDSEEKKPLIIKITSKGALNNTGLSPELKNEAGSSVDFSKSDLLLLTSRGRPASLCGLTQKGKDFIPYTCVMKVKSSCELNIAEEKMIRGEILKTDKTTSAQVFQKPVILDVLSDCEGPTAPVRGHHLKKVNFGITYQSPFARFSEKKLNMTLITSIWGEWEVWLRKHCPDCEPQPSLPPGFPEDSFVLALTDHYVAPFGYARLEASEVLTDEEKLYLNLKRTVYRCPGRHEEKTPLLILNLKKEDLPPGYSLKEENIRMKDPMIPTFQSDCEP